MTDEELPEDVWAALDEREKKVVSLRFGLGGMARTLADVGHKLGVSRERVRQIQNIALSKMRRKLARDYDWPIEARADLPRAGEAAPPRVNVNPRWAAILREMDEIAERNRTR